MIFSLDTATLSEMKQFAKDNNIPITGDKRVKDNWAGSIEKWQFVMNEAAACLADADAMATQADDVAEVVVVKAVEVLTSPTAIKVYKTIFHALALVIALVVLMSWKVAKWCWAHRADTALAHWIVAFKASKIGRRCRAWLRWMGRKLDRELQSVVMLWVVDRLGRVSWT